ncbi:DUF5047 domain-containing protein [Amycolatopsis japonica]|uniref:DUF5047 domain-containing protein n=1 Tax=Amycolatopsis japonica TaxID=208439 RepID=UPI0037B0B2D2
MRPVTDSFLATVRGAHKMVARARICAPGQVGVNPVGTEIPIISGDVVMDSTADITSTLSLTTHYDWPYDATDLGTPYGQEIFVERGVTYGNGTTEYVGLGYFRIEKVEQTRTDGQIRITASDRMASLIDARLTQPVQFGAGASVQSVIDYLVSDGGLSGVPVVYDYSAGADLLGTSHIADRERVKFMQDVLNSRAKIMYFDYAGRLQVKSRPDPTKAAVFTINHGRNGVLVDAKRALSRDGVYNAVVATGEPVGEQTPVMGAAFDLVSTSPTYYYGTFGKVPRFFSSSFLETNAQCVAAAQSMLLTVTGLPYNVSLGLVPNPALEASDVVTVTYNDHLNPETHIIDRLTIPLDAEGVMSIETRKQYL